MKKTKNKLVLLVAIKYLICLSLHVQAQDVKNKPPLNFVSHLSAYYSTDSMEVRLEADTIQRITKVVIINYSSLLILSDSFSYKSMRFKDNYKSVIFMNDYPRKKRPTIQITQPYDTLAVYLYEEEPFNEVQLRFKVNFVEVDNPTNQGGGFKLIEQKSIFFGIGKRP